MTLCRHFLRASAIALVVASCEEAPVSLRTEAADEATLNADVRETESPCPGYYYFNFNSDRMGDDKYCARLLARCIGPTGRPRDRCA